MRLPRDGQSHPSVDRCRRRGTSRLEEDFFTKFFSQVHAAKRCQTHRPPHGVLLPSGKVRRTWSASVNGEMTASGRRSPSSRTAMYARALPRALIKTESETRSGVRPCGQRRYDIDCVRLRRPVARYRTTNGTCIYNIYIRKCERNAAPLRAR